MYKKKKIPALLWGWNHNSGKQSRTRWPPTTSALVNLSGSNTCSEEKWHIVSCRLSMAVYGSTSEWGGVHPRVLVLPWRLHTSPSPSPCFCIWACILAIISCIRLSCDEKQREEFYLHIIYFLSFSQPKYDSFPELRPETKTCWAHVLWVMLICC